MCLNGGAPQLKNVGTFDRVLEMPRRIPRMWRCSLWRCSSSTQNRFWEMVIAHSSKEPKKKMVPVYRAGHAPLPYICHEK